MSHINRRQEAQLLAFVQVVALLLVVGGAVTVGIGSTLIRWGEADLTYAPRHGFAHAPLQAVWVGISLLLLGGCGLIVTRVLAALTGAA